MKYLNYKFAFSFVICIIVSFIFLSVEVLAAEDCTIRITYSVNNEQFELSNTSFEAIGGTGDGDYNIKIFRDGDWWYDQAGEGTMYIATLPNNASITGITFPEFGDNETKWIIHKDSDKVTRESLYSDSLLTEEYYLHNGEFWDVRDPNFNSAITLDYGEDWYLLEEGKSVPVTDVKGLIITGDNQQDRKDIVFIQIPNTVELNKEGLEQSIANASPEGFYTEDDQWNGKTFSTHGFWYDLQNSSAVKNAKKALTDAITQDEIDSAKTTLDNALPVLLADLIPTDQVNSTKLYNTRRLYTLSDEDKTKYSTKSIQKYENAETAAQAAYDTLFDSDGNVLESNRAGRQTEIDAVADALKAAYDDLLGKTSETDIVRWKEAADWVSGKNVVEADYTEDSYRALSTALATIKTIADEHEDITEILSSKNAYQAYTSAVAQALCAYYQLEEIEAITVHVRIVDNYGIQYPDEAIADPRMANFDDDVTLSVNKTIQGLFMPGEGNGNLNTEPDHDPVPRTGVDGVDDTCEHAHTYVYINGKLAIPAIQADPSELARMNPSAGHMDVYYGEDPSNGKYYQAGRENPQIEDRFPVLKNALHNGDNVVVVRTRAPYYQYYQSGGNWPVCFAAEDIAVGFPLSLYYDSFGFLKLNCSDITGDHVEKQVGEQIELAVSFSHTDAIIGETIETEEASGVSILTSESFETKEQAAIASGFSKITVEDEGVVKDVVTDLDGIASVVFSKEGWYKVAVMDLQDSLSVGSDFLPPYNDQYGIYPYLKTADSMLVYVSFDEEREALTTEKQAADAVITEADTAKAAYEESKAAAEEASKTPGPEAVAAAEQALTDAEAAKEKADAAKTAADAYLEKVQALEAKKDQMTPTNKTDIEAKLAEAKEMAGAAEKAGDAAAEEMQKASEVLDKVTTKADLLACQEEIEQLKSDIQAKQQEIDDLNGEISDLKEQNTANQTKIDNLETEIAEAEGKIASLEESGDSNQEEIEQLKSDIQAKQQKIDALNEQITANQGEINQLKDKVEAAQSAIDTMSQADPLAEARTEAINRVNKYLEDNTKNMLASDADSAELAALKALITIKDAKTADEITKAADAAIAKFDEKIAAKKAADEKAAKIKAAKAQKVTGLKVKVKKNKASVSWKKNTEVTGYEVYRSNKKKSGYKKIKTLKKNTKIKFVNKKLKKGKKYFYKVRSFTTIDGKAYYGKYTAVKATKKIK